MKNITSTVGHINESSDFFREDWQHNGKLIVAIHGKDKSTEEKYSKLPADYVLISVREKKNGILGSQQVIGAHISEEVTA
jgi:hypothetical protein